MKKIDFMKPEMQVIKMTAKTSLLQASSGENAGGTGKSEGFGAPGLEVDD